MKKYISLLLAVVVIFCLAACSDPPEGNHNQALDNLVAVRYRGESASITKLAPKEYWTWYESEGRKVSELITYSSGAYNSWLNVIGGQYGENLTVTYTITSEETLDKDTQKRFIQEMERKYGIDADTISGGKTLFVTFTLTGSLKTDTIDSEFILFTIDGTQYLVRAADDNGNFTVDFQIY